LMTNCSFYGGLRNSVVGNTIVDDRVFGDGPRVVDDRHILRRRSDVGSDVWLDDVSRLDKTVMLGLDDDRTWSDANSGLPDRRRR
jgi:hypothetical protein